jgi:hypothetical protein
MSIWFENKEKHVKAEAEAEAKEKEKAKKDSSAFASASAFHLNPLPPFINPQPSVIKQPRPQLNASPSLAANSKSHASYIFSLLHPAATL